MTVIKNVIELPDSKVFLGIYESTGYTGYAGVHYYSTREELNWFLSDGYKPRIYITTYKFPVNFIPKARTPYITFTLN